LLIHESGSLRIGDFGCSLQTDTAANPNALVTNTAGTMAFWPPESIAKTNPVVENDDDDVIRNAECSTSDMNTNDIDDLPPTGMDNESNDIVQYSAYGADIWAAGVTIHCLLYGVLPFSIECSNPVDIMDKILAYRPPAYFISPSSMQTQSDNNNNNNSDDYSLFSSRPYAANEVWRQMLLTAPLRRMSLSEAFQTEWLSAEATRRKGNK
jgi:hypothetical protein